ncbi:MAG: hypothetical protein A3B31_03940 [Candidatus Komeilibacteria bacterium RIFCSPLOWO2_01_FULL_53_11]|uniref:Gcp-like domain-containing protein n=1 Tax=Candidatus Komeilibacteria bacterium RIFCSPLOWO2_01_FULL_53_11 TaxID=1798552 RepID=A0A1G2BTW8_9BACT|nr:MAG: hypothetical protein A3B31_03940 [Candidatus Komeilibacteria bacterium RIFCSPLOWO2_01_FULL_53_11]
MIIWAYHHPVLRWGVVDKGTYRAYQDEVPQLDLGLLPLLRRRRLRPAQLGSIAVCPELLGGFASARLILATLNTIAWLSDIPIFAVPQEWSCDEASVAEKLGSMKKVTSFLQQVLPHYAAPPDISIQKKKKKFTIT